MKSLVSLLEDLLQDCGRRSGAPVNRDVITLRSRVEHEGDSFITITLPSFCKDFERSLDEGRIVPGLFASFGKLRSGIPEFLQGFLHDVFDKSGTLLTIPSIVAIRSVRQICLFGKKLRRRCSNERSQRAIDEFVKCDSEVSSAGDSQLWVYYRLVARILMDTMDLDSDEALGSIVPRHGPGTTRERIRGNQKWIFRRWHSRLEHEGMTYLRYGRASQPDEDDEWPLIVDPEDEEPVRVVLVPKTLKAPRVIAVEPVCMQFMQQGLSRLLVDRISKSGLTAGHVNFRDQSVNQALAQDASDRGHLATIDMSEASDRVSLAHVEQLFEFKPEFLKLVLATRSTRVQLPSGDTYPLKKFASMGSALCFPVESMVFYTSIIAARLLAAHRFPNAHSVREFSRDVYVFGDDLIFPVDEASAICDSLESLGFKVNRRKSFWTGKFRESCGADCYGGSLVTPVYMTMDIPANRGDTSRILSCVATCNQLFEAGYWLASAALRKAVERVVGKLPTVPHDCPALGWHHYSELVPRKRWDPDLLKFETLSWIQVPSWVDDPLDGDPALAKCFRKLGKNEIPRSIVGLKNFDPLRDPEHLEESPRPYGLSLKRRWVAWN